MLRKLPGIYLTYNFETNNDVSTDNQGTIFYTTQRLQLWAPLHVLTWCNINPSIVK